MVRMIKLIIFFFSNSIFAFIVSLYIHECGHAFFVRFLLGIKPVIKMNPLSGGITSYTDVPTSMINQLLICSGGIIAGIVIGIIITFISIRYIKKIWAAPFLLTGIVSISINSSMMVLGLFAFKVVDVQRMICFGLPRHSIFLIGSFFTLLSLILFIYSMPYWGFGKDSSLRSKMIVILGSVVIYAIVVIVYIFINDKVRLFRLLQYIVSILLMVSIGTAFSHYGSKFFVRQKAVSIRLCHIIYSMFLSVSSMLMIM